jgi:NAD-dependent oxidoreductase involved in siderophore biosynthesis
MKKIAEKLYGNLSSRERFVAAWEAIGRGDENEAQKLQDTAPRHQFTGPDSVIRKSWTAIIAISLGIEADISGCVLTFQLAHHAGQTETAIASLKKMKKIDAMWRELLKEIGFSEAAIKAVRPKKHPLVEHLLTILKNHTPEPDDSLDAYFQEIRQMIPILHH